MTLTVTTVLIILSGAAAIFGLMAFIRAGNRGQDGAATTEQVSNLLRNESDRVRQSQDEQSRALRQELGDNLRGFQETTLAAFKGLGETLESTVKEFGERLDGGVKAIGERADAIRTKLDSDLARMGEEAGRNREALRQTIEGKLDESAARQATAAKSAREEMAGSFQTLGGNISRTLAQLGDQQKERLENVAAALTDLTGKHQQAQESLRQAVEGRLDAIRTENASKLDEMRKTVDEKLQSTLENRLGESFKRVVEQLERVYKGIGEMQTLAAGVGDLKKVLSNVRARGTFGEVQVAILLEQFLSPEQYIGNAQVKESSQERVEFAIRLPGSNDGGEVLLPVDSKFPLEDYERLVAASELGDSETVAQASKDLENRIKQSARIIREKYIAVPRTTDFAILFLPTEGLYAEVLRRPGLFEQIQREHHVTLSGPATFTALLNALQMGFRTLAIEKRSSEVWQILGAVKNEFNKYGDVVDRLSKQLTTAAKSVENLGTRARVMSRKLRDVEALPDEEGHALLGPGTAEAEDVEEIEVVPEGDDVEPQGGQAGGEDIES